ncbi:MAG TPA: Mov34/MPN/PAD-1 family protein [Candidatus Angelobacter sp.]|jgi:proteasome lid subunit RPN8/RPN11
MAKPAKVKIRVSTQPVVVMEAEVARKIRQHARTSMKAEVCGVLIGSTEHERMTVEACIQGNNAAQGGAHVTFTQDTWEHIYKIKDKDYPEQKIVGWYHSHPGFGVFLSEHDLFIQQNFFSNPQQVAWVYDPHTDEEGCFGWIGGNIEKLSGIRVGYTQEVDAAASTANDYEEDEDEIQRPSKLEPGRKSDEAAWVRWASLAIGYMAAIILGIVAGFLFRDWQTAPVIDTMNAIVGCQHIQWQSPLCQSLLVQLAPASMAPALPIQVPQAAPQGQGSPLPQTREAPASQTPGPAKSPQISPPQEQAPAQKGNNAKHG